MIFEELALQNINILIALGSIVVLYLGWQSTYVRYDRITPTVLILESRRQILENVVSPQIAEERVEEPLNFTSEYLEHVINDVNTSMVADLNQESIDTLNELIANNESGQQQIINVMDNPDTAEGLRRRRLAFYEQDDGREHAESTNNTAVRNSDEIRPQRRDLNIQTGDSAHADNCSNENNENENISKNEENKMHGEPLKPNEATAPPILEEENVPNDEFRIKLKYLNDDLTLVKGSPNEQIGDFKRRNFAVELASQKLVRLVFNGHVLQPDTKTLQVCGLFDNCVVHCLVHKKSTSANSNISNEPSGSENQQSAVESDGIRNGGSILNGHLNGPLVLYIGIAIVTTAILFCWYCRIQYSSLFSLYSTIGLILMTALFIIIFPLVILIERDVAT